MRSGAGKDGFIFAAADLANSAGQGWAFLGNVAIGANLYEHYAIGASDLYVDTDVGGTIS